MNEYLSENMRMSDVTSVDGQLTDKRTEDPYEMDKCVKWIEAHNLEKVCLQFPDDLLSDSVNIALHIEKYINRKVYILGDTTCGSCCVDTITARHVNADGIIHFGHACLNPVNEILAFHVLPKKEIDVTRFQDQFKEALKDTTKKCILFYDVAYAHLIECIYNDLKAIFKNLILSRLNCKSNVEFTDSKDPSTMVILGRRYILTNDTTINDYEAIFLGENGKTFSTLAMSIPAKKWQILPPDGLNYCNFETSMETDVSLISGDIRNADKDILCIDKMDALVLKTPGVVAVGNAGAQFLQERSWKGVEQRLGKDSPCPAHIGRSGLASHYNNELFSTGRKGDMQA
ncbi:2-(3-amino-3-carboxypropyl)histidine synthase subunit 2 isoform X3 [Vespa velutina]|uniref:2-(3-amino-3-carboxypropyl)histidine synthase subunit 2 isoform X3 n=1 Tax=Vespa velutina TaxID=202808 RepID=UPI001FB48631|nr:2-(3-amino-3-carboxypropyl)histidine synthase subunit 2 isoform X3 [Vespa velutina]